MKPFKSVALMTAAVAALAAGEAAAQSRTSTVTARPLKPMYGNIQPFYGNIQPFYGNISPFYGNISPFYGNITPFYGNITPFYGNISPFYGDISAFWGNITPFYGNISPFYGNITPFWRDITAFWGDISAFWKTTDQTWAAGGFSTAADNLKSLSSRSETLWGAAVKARTGKSFAEAFANPLFAKYSLDPDKPDSLKSLTSEMRQAFFLDWFDGLMNYSGMDRVDHWMQTINWNPALTQVQGDGKDAVIGLLDFFVAGDADVQDNIKYFNGVSKFSNGHGAAVASLMVAAHDGQGVMGIAPQASVVAYNPFDSTGTAGWGDVRNGIVAITSRGAHVVNMSLGVKGWTLHPDWRAVFADDKVRDRHEDTIFVLAAGNDGVTQTQNVAWTWEDSPNLIVVGSVDPNRVISTFSNRPGETCLLNGGKCNSEEDKLKYRFMVAPGELILVSDDKGGVTRQSGTSFAAPLVTGTIALIHDRWPWLTEQPGAVTQILFRSATDLGDKGVDPVYGWGLLNATAALSALDSSRLEFKLYENGSVKSYSAKSLLTLKSKLDSGVWQTSNAYMTVFEKVADTYRDFAIPLSNQLTGTTTSAFAGTQQFQGFMQQWLFGMIRGTSKLNDSNVYTGPSGWSFTAESELAPQDDRSVRQTAPVYYRFSGTTPSGRGTIAYGYGAGALGLARQSGFALQSDYSVSAGGVNPLLGFASGGPFASVGYKLAPNLALTAGASRDGWDEVWTKDAANPLTIGLINELRPYHAGAVDVGLTWDATPNLAVKASYTRLKEQDALLGVQSRLTSDLTKGSTTEGLTLGADASLPYGVRLAASGTLGRTLPTRSGSQNLAVAGDGLKTSAWQVAATKSGLFDKADGLRLSLAQKLHVDDGELEHTSVRVVDRNTGAIGLVRDRVQITGGDRDYVAQAIYVRELMDGKAELQGYARYDTAAVSDRSRSDTTAGLSLKIRY